MGIFCSNTDCRPIRRKMKKVKLLFVCNMNEDRSPRGEHVFANDDRFEVKSAGINCCATTPLTIEHIVWSDVIFVMEVNQVIYVHDMITMDRIRKMHSDSPVANDKPIINLEIQTISTGRIDVMIKQRAMPFLSNNPILPLNE
jgi:predicted protein tyrosine phosphatase